MMVIILLYSGLEIFMIKSNFTGDIERLKTVSLKDKKIKFNLESILTGKSLLKE